MYQLKTETKKTELLDIVILGFGTEFNHTFEGKYKETMELLMNYGLKNGVRFINSSVYQYNPKKVYFSEGGTFDGKTWNHVKKIKPAKVLYKSNKINHLTNHIQEEFDFYNDLKLILLANNKFDTARHFKKYSPITFRLSDIEKRSFNIDNLKKDEYIIKPVNGSGGAGIMKVKKSQLIETIKKFWYGKENVIIQEFVDMSCGVPGIVEGMHDLRFSIFGKKIFPHVYIRTPKKGDFRSNVSAGGSDFFVSLRDMPVESITIVKSIVKDIYENMGGGIYSIDIVNTTEGYKLMELNSSPGFLFKEIEIQNEFFKYIVNSLK